MQEMNDIGFDPDMTIEQLEKNYWSLSDLESATRLIEKCHKLRKKPLNEFSVEDMRLMIGQNIGLDYLIPMALNVLDEDILTEGDYYEGDLLQNVLRSDPDYWRGKRNSWARMKYIFTSNEEYIESSELTDSIKEDLRQSFSSFLLYVD